MSWIFAIDHPLPTGDLFDNRFVCSRLLLCKNSRLDRRQTKQRYDVVCYVVHLKCALNKMIIYHRPHYSIIIVISM